MASIYKDKRTGKWKIAYSPRPRRRKVVTGCTDYKATKALADKLESESWQLRTGVADSRSKKYAQAEANPLIVKDAEGKIVGGHVADFHAALLAKGVTDKQAQEVRFKAVRVLDLCKAQRVSDISPSAIQTAIAHLRDEEHLSLQTCNHHLRAVKQFSRWLRSDGRSREDAISHLSGYNVKLDRRHDRRALCDDELARLIEAAERGPVVLGMSGHDRAVLYRLAVGTGFRANEIRSLTADSFNLDADQLTITIEAAYSKHRRQDVQPIRQDLADLLRPWLADKPAGSPVFQLPEKPVELVKADLGAASQAWLREARTPQERKTREGSDYLAYSDASGHFADFHSLRHAFVTRLAQSGVAPAVAKTLARHSTITLTMDKYTHTLISDEMAALDSLPTIGTPKPDKESAKATGTYSVAADEVASAGSAWAARSDPGTPKRVISGQHSDDEPAFLAPQEIAG